MVQKTSKEGLDFIKGFETFVPFVYDDLVPPVKGKYKEWNGGTLIGTPTIGYGHTDAAKHPLKIRKGLRITEKEACEILAVDLADCEADVRRLVKKPLTQGQFDACSSFTFNCGPGNFKNIAARINRGDYNAARAAFDLYVKSKGKYMRGLQRRRDGEQSLWDDTTPALIEHADTFHPAEVDDPPELGKAKPPPPVKEMVSVSRKAWLISTIRRWATKLGIGTGGVGVMQLVDPDGPTSEVVSFLQANALWLFLACSLTAIITASALLIWMQEDVASGRAIPSKEA